METHNRKNSISSEENDFPNSYANLEFNVKYETKIGQILHICGNKDELGNWDADSSPRLHTYPKLYPVWKNSFEFSLPIGMTLEYKYVIIDQNNNKIWEDLPNNSIRTLTMKQPGNFVIYNEMGNLDLKIINKSTSAEIKPNSHIN